MENSYASAEIFKHYDPRNVYSNADEEKDASVIWTTQSVNWALDAMKKGQKLKRSPFFEGDPRKRKGKLVFQMSDYELSELTKCMSDIRYFIEKYCKVKHKNGNVDPMKLRPYQQQQVDDFLENARVILGWSRQSGKTIGTSVYILWKLLFFTDKKVALLANKLKTAKNVLKEIKAIYINLPFFLQGGIMGWNDSAVAFDTDNSIECGPATLDALNGLTCNILYIDEFAFIGKGGNKIEYQREFLANCNPIVSAQDDGQIIISSTPNGKDIFYELFNAAMKLQNSYKGSMVKWYQIPGKDEEWAKREISEIGEDKFKIQYELSFDTSQDSLLGAKTLNRIEANSNEYSEEFELISNHSQFLKFKKGVTLENKYKEAFLLSCDLAEGLGQDYTVCQILRLEWSDKLKKFRYRQIGIWRSNTVSIDEFANVIAELFYNLNPNYSKLLVEQNTYGDTFFKVLTLNQDYDIDLESICRFKRAEDSDKLKKGLRTNSKIKMLAVKSFQTMVIQNTLVINEKQTSTEVSHFKKDKKGNYNAELGNDDTVTPLINACYFISMAEVEFQNWVDDYKELTGLADAEIIYKIKRGKEDDEDDIDESKLSPEVRALLNSV